MIAVMAAAAPGGRGHVSSPVERRHLQAAQSVGMCTGNTNQLTADFSGRSYSTASVECPADYRSVGDAATTHRGCAHHMDGQAIEMSLVQSSPECAVLGAAWSSSGDSAAAQLFVACVDPASGATTCVPLIELPPTSQAAITSCCSLLVCSSVETLENVYTQCDAHAHSCDPVCRTCPAGQAPTADLSACEACGPGMAGSDGTCNECSPGTAPNSARTSCDVCAGNGHSNDGILCSTCVIGTEPLDDRTGCSPCGPGHVSPTGTACTQCAGGMQPNADSSACVSCVALSVDLRAQCASGEYSADGIACIACPQGQFPSVTMRSCEPCLMGMTGGAVRIADLRGIELSVYWNPDGLASRLDCDPGEEPLPNSTGCRSCEDFVRLQDGSQALLDIGQDGARPYTSTTGLTCVACGVGKNPSDDRSRCDDCGIGESSDGSQCTRCPAGTQPNQEKSGCNQCLVEGSNMYSTDGIDCVSCPAGSQPNAERSACETCASLTASVTSDPDLVALVKRDINATCTAAYGGCTGNQTCATDLNDMLVANSLPVNGSVELMELVTCVKGADVDIYNHRVGLYSVAGGACMECGSGKEPAPGTQASCRDCGAGEYSGGDHCRKCSPGTQTSSDKSRCDPCMAKGESFYSDDGVTCDTCSPGSQPLEDRTDCVSCKPGYHSPTGGPCSLCEGTTVPIADMSDCRDCAPGESALNGTCVCAAGSYNASKATLQCYNSNVSNYIDLSIDEPGDHHCRPCPTEGCVHCAVGGRVSIAPGFSVSREWAQLNTEYVPLSEVIQSKPPSGGDGPHIGIFRCPAGAKCCGEGEHRDQTTAQCTAVPVTNGSGNVCADDREGVLCSLCRPGTTRTGLDGECRKCGEDWTDLSFDGVFHLGYLYAVVLPNMLLSCCLWWLNSEDDSDENGNSLTASQNEASQHETRGTGFFRSKLRNLALFVAAIACGLAFIKILGESEPDKRSAMTWFYIMFVPSLFGIITIELNPDRTRNSRDKVKTTLTFVQVLSEFQGTFMIPFPLTFTWLIELFEILKLDFIKHAMGLFMPLYCVRDYTFFDKWLVAVSSVFMQAAFAWLLHAVHIKCQMQIFDGCTLSPVFRKRDPPMKDKQKRLVKDRLIRVFFIALFLFFPPVSRTLLDGLICRRLSNDESYLRADMQVSCESSEYQNMRWLFMVVAVLFVLGIPAFIGWLLRNQRRKATHDEHELQDILIGTKDDPHGIFDELDEDHDGRLDKGEMRQLLRYANAGEDRQALRGAASHQSDGPSAFLRSKLQQGVSFDEEVLNDDGTINATATDQRNRTAFSQAWEDFRALTSAERLVPDGLPNQPDSSLRLRLWGPVLRQIRIARFKDRWAFAVADYKESYYWWDCIEMLRKVVLTGLLAFGDQVPWGVWGDPGSMFQLVFGICISTTFTVVVARLNPYETQESNNLKIGCDASTVITLVFAMMLSFGDLEKENIGAGNLGKCLVVVTAFPFAFVFVAQHMYKHRWSYKTVAVAFAAAVILAAMAGFLASGPFLDSGPFLVVAGIVLAGLAAVVDFHIGSGCLHRRKPWKRHLDELESLVHEVKRIGETLKEDAEQQSSRLGKDWASFQLAFLRFGLVRWTAMSADQRRQEVETAYEPTQRVPVPPASPRRNSGTFAPPPSPEMEFGSDSSQVRRAERADSVSSPGRRQSVATEHQHIAEQKHHDVLRKLFYIVCICFLLVWMVNIANSNTPSCPTCECADAEVTRDDGR